MTAGTVLRYLADGSLAGRLRPCPMSATPMFLAVPVTATVTVWANGSHIDQAKPGPLDPIGGST